MPRKKTGIEKRLYDLDVSQAQKWATRRILFGDRGQAPRPVYDNDVHPKALVAYFQDRYDQIEEPERVETTRGDAKYISKPVAPATMAGFAASIGVARQTLAGWRDQHEDFREAYEIALSIQEDHMVRCGTQGGLQPLVTVMTLKNHQGWKDKTDVALEGPVTLKFDEQDKSA